MVKGSGSDVVWLKGNSCGSLGISGGQGNDVVVIGEQNQEAEVLNSQVIFTSGSDTITVFTLGSLVHDEICSKSIGELKYQIVYPIFASHIIETYFAFLPT